MAFPTIPTVAGGRILFTLNTAGGSPKTFPNLSSLTKNSGDMLIAVCVEYDGNSTDAEFSSWGASFTEVGDRAGTATMAIGVGYKISTGSETGTFTVATADTSTNDSVLILMSIAGVHQTTAPEVSVMTTSAGAPPAVGTALNPTNWASEDTLWIAIGGSGETSTTGSYTGISSAPTNYTDYADSGITADVVGGVEAAVAFRQLNAASEAPGAWGGDTSNARGAAIVIAVRPGTAHTANPSDTVALTDARTFAFDKGIPDTLSLADSATPVNEPPAGTNHTREPADTVALSDALDIVHTADRIPSDTVALADSLTRTVAYVRTIQDSIVMSDNAASAKAIPRTIVDGLGSFRSDDFNRAAENPLAGDWTTTTSDGALKIVDGYVTQDTIDGLNDGAIYDGSTFPDDQWSAAKLSVNCTAGVRRGPALFVRHAAAAKTCYRISVDHAASTNCNISRFLAGSRTTILDFTQAWTDGDEWRLVVDGPASAARLRVYLNGTLIQTVTDSSGSGIGSGYPGIGVSDNVEVLDVRIDDWTAGAVNPIADSFSRILDYGRTQNDGVILTDATIDSQGIRLGDTVVPSDNFTRVHEALRSVVDSVLLSDARTFSFGKLVADSITLADLLDAAKGKAVQLDDSIVLSDQWSRIIDYGRTQQDGLFLTDATIDAQGVRLGDVVVLADLLARVTVTVRDVVDSIVLADARAFSQGKLVADALVLSDQMTKVLDMARTLTDDVVLADQLQTAASKTKALSDSVILSDAATIAQGKAIIDLLALADQFARTADWVRLFADQIVITDQVDTSMSGTGTVNIDDSITLTDQFTRIATYLRDVADSVLLADARSFGIGKTIGETIVLTDQMARTVVYLRSVADTLVLTDQASPVSNMARQVDDLLAIADSFQSVMSFTRTVSDVILLDDAVQTLAGKGISVNDLIFLTDDVTTVETYLRFFTDQIVLTDLLSTDLAGPIDFDRRHGAFRNTPYPDSIVRSKPRAGTFRNSPKGR